MNRFMMLFALLPLLLAGAEGKTVNGWDVAGGDAFAITAKNGELRISAREKSRGELLLSRIVPVEPGVRLYYCADVEASAGGHLRLEIVPVEKPVDRKMQVRYRSSLIARKGMQKLRVEAESRGAHKVKLTIRIVDALPGMNWTVRNPGMVPADAQKVAPKLAVMPGFASAGVFLSGLAAEEASAFRSGVFFRERGAKEWLPAYPLDYQKPDREARGVLVNLKEDTPYEVRVEFVNDGKAQTLETAFRTKSGTVPVAKTIPVTPEMIRNGLRIDRSGSETGWIRYTAAPGTILESAGENAITMKDVQYVLLEGLTIRGGRHDGIRISCCDHVRIINCDISRFGRVGEQKMFKHGWYYENGRMLNMDAGISLWTVSDFLMERNFIHDANGRANPWFYSHPAGPKGVYAHQVSEATIRYNDIIGGDLHRWNDCIESADNSGCFGAFYRNVEVYGNFFTLSNDDGMELDGGEMCARFFRNRIEGTLCGVSSGSCARGPCFIFDNVFNFSGDENGLQINALKNGHGDFGHGKVHFFHNSVNGYSQISGAPGADVHFRPDKQVALNNVFRSTKTYVGARGLFGNRNDRNVYDYNLITVPGQTVLPELQEKYKQELHSIEAADPGFRDGAAGDLRLTDHSPAKGKGTPVPNFSLSAVPDMGAQDWDQPFRPLAVMARPAILNFASEKAPAQSVTVTAAPGAGKQTFRIEKTFEAEWLSVLPETGTVEPGKPLTLKVAPIPEKFTLARLNRTAFCIRFADGYSRPVAVCVDTTSNPALLRENRKNVIPGRDLRCEKGEARCTISVPEEGAFFLMIYGQPGEGDLTVSVDGKDAFPGRFNAPYQVAGNRGARDILWYLLADRRNNKSSAPVKIAKGEHRLVIRAASGKLPEIREVALAHTCDELIPAAHTREGLPSGK